MEQKICIAKAKTGTSRKTAEPLFQQALVFNESPEGRMLQVNFGYYKFEKVNKYSIFLRLLYGATMVESRGNVSWASRRSDWMIWTGSSLILVCRRLINLKTNSNHNSKNHYYFRLVQVVPLKLACWGANTKSAKSSSTSAAIIWAKWGCSIILVNICFPTKNIKSVEILW